MSSARWGRFALVLMVLGLLLQSDALAASTVRGKLVRRTPYGTYPASGISVSVYALNSNMGRSRRSYTDASGFYYLYNIPPGRYKLEVWVANPPWNYDIVVDGSQQFTDIAPIQVP